MNTLIKELIKNEVTSQVIDNNGDLYEIVAQDSDNAVIYYYEAHKIVNEATQDEIENASEQMKDTGFVFEGMDSTATICAYWIMNERLGEEYTNAISEDLDTLVTFMEDEQDKNDAGAENEVLIDELQSIIDLLEDV